LDCFIVQPSFLKPVTNDKHRKMAPSLTGSGFDVDFEFAAGCGFDFAFEFVRASSPIVLGEPLEFLR
jgi:hypothetical protein